MQVQTSAGIWYKPKKRFWYFGLANVLRNRMFSDPTWCKLRGTGREEEGQSHDFWHSEEAIRLDEATDYILGNDQKSVSTYDLGLDWGQPFTFRTWSSGYVALRCIFRPEIPRVHAVSAVLEAR